MSRKPFNTLHFFWLAIACMYLPVFRQLYLMRWKDIDYTHAYFILPVALWLAWRERERLSELAAQGCRASAAGLTLLLAGCGLFFIGWRYDYLMISSLSFIPVVAGSIWYVYGRRMLRALAFPLGYLFLMVPPPLGVLDGITRPLRQMTSVAVEVIMRSFHYPIARDGLMLSVNGTEIFMGEPCSGFRSLSSLIALGLVYAYLSRLTFRGKALLVTSIVPFALVGNVLRVSGMCLVTFYFGQEAGETFHDAAGIAIFLLLILGLMGLETLMNADDQEGYGYDY